MFRTYINLETGAVAVDMNLAAFDLYKELTDPHVPKMREMYQQTEYDIFRPMGEFDEIYRSLKTEIKKDRVNAFQILTDRFQDWLRQEGITMGS